MRPGEEALAEQVARLAHAGQRDKSDAPYINHPERIAKAMPDSPSKTVAWLHDVLEDTPVTVEGLRVFGFSEDVITAVRIVTRTPGEGYRDFIRRIRDSGNPVAIRVKVGDLTDNLRPGCPEHLVERYHMAIAELSA